MSIKNFALVTTAGIFINNQIGCQVVFLRVIILFESCSSIAAPDMAYCY